MLKKGVSNEGVAIGAGISEGSVPRARFGMDLGPPTEQEVDDVDVALLGCLHQGSGRTKLDISTCDEKRMSSFCKVFVKWTEYPYPESKTISQVCAFST